MEKYCLTVHLAWSWWWKSSEVIKLKNVTFLLSKRKWTGCHLVGSLLILIRCRKSSITREVLAVVPQRQLSVLAPTRLFLERGPWWDYLAPCPIASFVWPDRLTLPLGRAPKGFSLFSFFFSYCNLHYLFKNCLVDSDFFGCNHQQYLPDSVGGQGCGWLCRA